VCSTLRRAVALGQFEVDLQHVDHFLADEAVQRSERVCLQNLLDLYPGLAGIAFGIGRPFCGDAIVSGKVSAVISDSPIQLSPFVFVPDDFLVQNGFRPALITDHFTLWTRTKQPNP